jgi:Sulfotransferase domain
MKLLDTVTTTLARITGRGQQRQSLGFEPKPHYYYLASFPKSGNTWVRFLLANVIFEPGMGLKGFGRYVPDSHIKSDLPYMGDPTSPFNTAPRQFVKTHFRYQPEFQNVIYVSRDGRDAITSYYHWINARSKEPVALRDIIAGNTVWGLWSDHVLGWMRGRCNRMLVKYEDLFRDTPGQLRRMLDFAQIPADDDQITRAVQAASFESMREKEQELRAERQKDAPQPDQPAGEKIMFVRKGGSGDWRNLFSPADIELFWKHHRPGMEAAGYGA